MSAMDLDDSWAAFSPCRRYRYRLHRSWNKSRPYLAFIMLNPSTADEAANDPTVRRCIGYAQRWGFGGLTVGNIFALRSTDPRALYACNDPVGPENDAALLEIASLASTVVCAWGTHGALRGRGAAVLALLRGAGVAPGGLKLNADGSPAHPLYLRSDAVPMEIPA